MLIIVANKVHLARPVVTKLSARAALHVTNVYAKFVDRLSGQHLLDGPPDVRQYAAIHCVDTRDLKESASYASC